jgi:hypothetical protein
VAAEVNFVVEVWAGGVTGRADYANDLSDHNRLSFVDVGLDEHVAVACHDCTATVFDVDVPSAARCLW